MRHRYPNSITGLNLVWQRQDERRLPCVMNPTVRREPTWLKSINAELRIVVRIELIADHLRNRQRDGRLTVRRDNVGLKMRNDKTPV